MICRHCLEEIEDGLEICPYCHERTELLDSDIGYEYEVVKKTVENRNGITETKTEIKRKFNRGLAIFQRYGKRKLGISFYIYNISITVISLFSGGIVSGLAWLLHTILVYMLISSVCNKTLEEVKSSGKLKILDIINSLVLAVFAYSMIIGVGIKIVKVSM